MQAEKSPSTFRLGIRILNGLPKIGPFLGLRALVALAIGIVAGLSQGFVEIGLAAFLQLFLRETKILEASIQLPGFLQSWHPSILMLSLSLIGIGFFRSFNQFLMAQSSSIANDRITLRLRILLVDRILRAEQHNFVPLSYTNKLIGSIFPIASAVCSQIAGAIPNVIMVAVLIVTMYNVAAKETLLSLIGIGILGLVANEINSRIAEHAKQLPLEDAELARSLVRVARNWLLVKILRTEDAEKKRMQTSVTRMEKIAHGTHTWIQVSGILPSGLGMVLIASVIAVSRAYWNTSGVALLSFLYLFVRFVQVFSAVASSAAFAYGGSPQFIEAWRFFFHESPRHGAELDSQNNLPDVGGDDKISPSSPVAKAPSIYCTGMQFSYAEDLPSAIKVGEFNVPSGSQLAIVGPSGSGKSTLLLVILGILRPSSGKLLIDGMNSTEFFSKPKEIGYVGAEPFLVAGSILENITYGLRSKPTERECWDALLKASMYDFVNSLPNKLEYQIGEDGSGLSAGQKQRIALARAFLAKPTLLILDEATSNLDLETEREIVSSISALRGNTTTIIVSHREAAMVGADQRIVLSAP